MSDERDLLAEVAEGLVVRPGDTLVLRLAKDIAFEDFERFRDQTISLIKERTPGVEVLIVGGAVEQIAVVRADRGGDAQS